MSALVALRRNAHDIKHGITGLIRMRARRAENLVSAMDGNILRRNQIAVLSLFIAVPMLLAVLVFVVLKQLLRIRKLQNIITICAWTQRVNFNGRWMRMEEFLWNRFRVKVSHGISEEAFDGVVGMIGKNITVSDGRAERLNNPKAQPDAKSGN